jgi:TrmH RNA methyltransferase
MKNKQNNELAVCGFAAVKELEKNSPERIRRLYFTADKAPLFGGLCRHLAEKHGIYNQVNNEDLQKLSGTLHHEGVVAMVSPPQIYKLNSDIVDQWCRDPEAILYLDNIGNTNNFGAIIRSAAFFGIKNIIIPDNSNQATISTSTYRIAKGGMEYVNIYSVKNVEFFFKDIDNKIIKIGTDVNNSFPLSKINDLFEKDNIKKPVMVILGNEETGISDFIKNQCDYLVTIPTPKRNLDSLNVAQACSIICYELSKYF